MNKLSIEQELKNNAYPGRGIILGKSADGKKAVAAYFIMGRSENSRNRVFVFITKGELSMNMLSIEQELKNNAYPGRGIILGKSADGKKAVAAYFIMGRSENSRNRVFVEEGEGIRTQAFDPSKLTDPSLIIYAPVRVLGNKTIVTNGDMGIRQIPFTKVWTIN